MGHSLEGQDMLSGGLSFCCRCAAPLAKRRLPDGRVRPACPSCGLVVYLEPKLVVVAVVERSGTILMVRRNMEPAKGLWSLPGGFVDRGEAIEEAIQREVQEETGLKVAAKGLLGLYSERGNPVVLAAYTVEVLGGQLRGDTMEVQELGFFAPDSLPPMAFPRDRRVIADWLARSGAQM